MSATKVAVVTGSNKGIGYAIVRALCKQFSGDVYLTARDEGRGKEAIASLEAEGLHPKFHQLDIDDEESVLRLKQFLEKTYGGLDVLVNNAGIAYKVSSTAPFGEQAEVTMKTNYWSTLRACRILFPILRSHARVVNVSSFASVAALNKCSDKLKGELKACKQITDVDKYMTKFVTDAKSGHHEEQGWPTSAYGVTKIGVTLTAPIMQRAFDDDASRTDIVINACCPGYIATDMSSFKGTKTIDEGANTPVYLALLPAAVNEPRGKFVSERKVSEY